MNLQNPREERSDKAFERQVTILELFTEAQYKGRSKRLNLARADFIRTRRRSSVVNHELNLRVALRRDVYLRICYLCGAQVEWRLGRRTLLEHICVDGLVRAPRWPEVTGEVLKLRAQGMSHREIGSHIGLPHTSVGQVLREAYSR